MGFFLLWDSLTVGHNETKRDTLKHFDTFWNSLRGGKNEKRNQYSGTGDTCPGCNI